MVFLALASILGTSKSKSTATRREISSVARLAMPSTTACLKHLLEAGLIKESKRGGKTLHYSISRPLDGQVDVDSIEPSLPLIVDNPIVIKTNNKPLLANSPLDTGQSLCLSLRDVLTPNESITQVSAKATLDTRVTPSEPSSLEPVLSKREQLRIRTELFLTNFCRGTGRWPKTKAEKARWLAGAQQLASEVQLTEEQVFCAAQRMAKEWSYVETQTPVNLARWWSRFHKPVIRGKHWNPGCGDHEPWMDLARKEFPPPVGHEDWWDRLQLKDQQAIEAGRFVWNQPSKTRMTKV
jgi:hypothetical protein